MKRLRHIENLMSIYTNQKLDLKKGISKLIKNFRSILLCNRLFLNCEYYLFVSLNYVSYRLYLNKKYRFLV